MLLHVYRNTLKEYNFFFLFLKGVTVLTLNSSNDVLTFRFMLSDEKGGKERNSTHSRLKVSVQKKKNCFGFSLHKMT